MKWSESVWQKAEPVFEGIITMPFIRELIAGTLALEKFKFYIAQDSKYLEHFGRALALIGARSNRVDLVLDFIRFAEGAIVVENALHASYFKEYGIDKNLSQSLACHHYTSYLLKEAALAQVEVAMASVLPCFWIYKKVGDHIFQQQHKQNNPYATWIDTYAGEEFGLLVEKAINICDEAANSCTAIQQEKMTEAFLYSCQLEWLFWDGAWRLEHWPF
ncbi:MAG: thiaminase II [Mucilaginibacter sp.]|uniref:thiaminase II n=1 Tax=Mucilaginibacter sp. TaxID=1882438 RepID=UPI0032667824